MAFDVGGLEEVGGGVQLVEGFGDGVEGELLGGGGRSCYFGWVGEGGQVLVETVVGLYSEIFEAAVVFGVFHWLFNNKIYQRIKMLCI